MHNYPNSWPRLCLLAPIAVFAALTLGVSPALAASVRPQVLESAPFSQPETFDAPTGIAVDQETGNVFVADSGADVVDVYGADGGAPTAGVPPQITGLEFRESEPEGIAVDDSCYYHQPRLSGSACETYDPSNGDVYVAESAGEAVGKYKLNTASHEYELVERLLSGSEPNGVAVDTLGDVYITNQREEPITEFNPSGTELGKIEQQELGSPAYIAVGTPGIVYVGNYGGRVVKLEVGSEDLVEHEELLSEEGKAVVVAANGNVLVDEETRAIEYSSSGTVESSLGAGALQESVGIAIDDETGYAYVTNRGERRNVEVFGTAVVLPDATTGAASAHKSDGTIDAELSGTVNPEATSVTSCEFEYGLSSEEVAYEHSVSCAQSLPLGGDAPVAVTAQASGLQGDTSYRYRLVAGNENGSTDGAEQRFTPTVSPSVSGQAPSVTHTTSTTALVNATIDTENSNSGYDIEYVEAAAYDPAGANPYSAGATTSPTSLPAGLGDEAVTIAVTGLRPATSYDYRVSATNQNGSEYGSNYTFTTAAPASPTAATGEATDVTQTSAVVSGVVNTAGLQTSYTFEIGPSTEYGTAIVGNAGSEAGEKALTADIQYLAPGVTYHYRLMASNADGTVYGVDRTFTTPAYPLAVPTPVSAFPILTGLSPVPAPKASTPSGTKPLTHAQKLAKALKQCKKDKPKSKRVSCERKARKKYGPTKKKAKK